MCNYNRFGHLFVYPKDQIDNFLHVDRMGKGRREKCLA